MVFQVFNWLSRYLVYYLCINECGYGWSIINTMPMGLVLSFRACLVDCNGNYIGIGIGIDITRNTKCCNVMLITIYLFGDNTIIEP